MTRSHGWKLKLLVAAIAASGCIAALTPLANAGVTLYTRETVGSGSNWESGRQNNVPQGIHTSTLALSAVVNTCVSNCNVVVSVKLGCEGDTIAPYSGVSGISGTQRTFFEFTTIGGDCFWINTTGTGGTTLASSPFIWMNSTTADYEGQNHANETRLEMNQTRTNQNHLQNDTRTTQSDLQNVTRTEQNDIQNLTRTAQNDIQNLTRTTQNNLQNTTNAVSYESQNHANETYCYKRNADCVGNFSGNFTSTIIRQTKPLGGLDLGAEIHALPMDYGDIDRPAIRRAFDEIGPQWEYQNSVTYGSAVNDNNASYKMARQARVGTNECGLTGLMTDFTLTGWINLSETADQVIFETSKYLGAGPFSPAISVHVSNNQLQALVRTSSAVIAQPAPLGWRHLTIGYNGDSEEMPGRFTAWINGSVAVNTTLGSTSVNVDGTMCAFGGTQNFNSTTASLAQWRIYKGQFPNASKAAELFAYDWYTNRTVGGPGVTPDYANATYETQTHANLTWCPLPCISNTTGVSNEWFNGTFRANANFTNITALNFFGGEYYGSGINLTLMSSEPMVPQTIGVPFVIALFLIACVALAFVSKENPIPTFIGGLMVLLVMYLTYTNQSFFPGRQFNLIMSLEIIAFFALILRGWLIFNPTKAHMSDA